MKNKKLIAVVGMPGAGKSVMAEYLVNQFETTRVRFGDVTDREMDQRGLERNQANERVVRESLRDALGMAAYAIKSEPYIQEALKTNDLVVLDGLYSWEEFLYLKQKYAVVLICLYARPKIRYQRLLKRKIRSFSSENEAHERDIAELTHLNKGGPIAIADYLVDNSGEIEKSYQQIDEILEELNVKRPN